MSAEMTERERLTELLKTAKLCSYPFGDQYSDATIEKITDHLLSNGVIVPPHKPIGVMSDGNEFNTDVYCPYCGTNLSGLYGDEPTRIIQCYNCGEFLDNRKTITKEEAEKALERSRG